MKTIAIIPAGGKGTRVGTSVPKQYIKADGKELIAYTLEVFQKSKLIDEIIIAAGKSYFEKLHNIIKEYNFTKISRLIEGGIERQDSVFNALKASSANNKDLIVVHDAARPFLTEDILRSAINKAKLKGNAIVSIAARDTLIKVNKFDSECVDRKNIYYVQTPQVFRYKILMDSMILAYKDNYISTDESTLIRRAGFKINFVEGSVINFKITTSADMKLFKKLVKLI